MESQGSPTNPSLTGDQLSGCSRHCCCRASNAVASGDVSYSGCPSRAVAHPLYGASICVLVDRYECGSAGCILGTLVASA
jgi:hypothetical protein